MSTRKIGVDYGRARIGLALSDEMKIIASPYKVLKAAKKLEETAVLLLQTVEEIENQYKCQIDAIVFGLPIHMDGSMSEMAEEVKQLIEILHPKCPNIEFITRDERLTSMQADRALREAKLSRKKRAAKIDVVSAVIILQNYLDQNHLHSSPPSI